MDNGKIYQAIPEIMGEINAIGKGKKSQQGYMYRGVDDVMNALNPALVKHKVFIVPEILEQIREDRQTARGGSLTYSICKMKFTFFAEDGSSVSAITTGEGMDSSDKSTNKAMAIAFKYACFQVFCIPTEEIIDPDAESHDVKSVGDELNAVIAKIVQECVRLGGQKNKDLMKALKKYDPAKGNPKNIKNLADAKACLKALESIEPLKEG